MTFHRTQVLIIFAIGILLGVGAVTGIGACIACKNKAKLAEHEQLLNHYGEWLQQDGKAIARLEGRN